MKSILLLSDTHGHLDEKILKYTREADEVWHAGDIGNTAVTDEISKRSEIRAVFGNIDGQELRSQFPENEIFICEGLKVMMTHIGGYPGKYTARVKKLITHEKPSLFISGHSHILKIIQDPKNNLLHLNPGACGVQGFHKIRTILRFQIDREKIKKMEAIELGMRGEINASDRLI